MKDYTLVMALWPIDVLPRACGPGETSKCCRWNMWGKQVQHGQIEKPSRAINAVDSCVIGCVTTVELIQSYQIAASRRMSDFGCLECLLNQAFGRGKTV